MQAEFAEGTGVFSACVTPIWAVSCELPPLYSSIKAVWDDRYYQIPFHLALARIRIERWLI
jgi:hypothetical protein